MHALLDAYFALSDALDACAASAFPSFEATLVDTLRAGEGGEVYGILVVALLLGACGVPIPEEAVFAVGGALAASGRASWLLVYALGWIVVLALDVVLHHVGTRLGPRVERGRLGRRIGAERWADMRDCVRRRGVWAVIGARFVMGMRIPAFLLAGALGMPRGRFLGAVAVAGLVTSAIPVVLGYLLGAHLDALLAALGAARWVLLGVFVPVIVWWLVRRRP